MDVAGKAALITGGGTGVGRATGLLLASKGCAVAVDYLDSEADALRTVEDIRALGVAAVAIRADVSRDGECRELVSKALEQLGRLDVLVNSAGVTEFIPAVDLDGVTEKTWQRIFAVNVQGAFQCARAAAPYLRADGGGDIVNISSVASITATGSCIPYSASKAALNNVTLSLGRVLAPEIRVNAVAPGFIAGRWLQEGLGDRYEATRQRFEAVNVLGQVCTPETIAEAVVGLVTGPDLVTGQVLAVDGGLLAADRGAAVGRP